MSLLKRTILSPFYGYSVHKRVKKLHEELRSQDAHQIMTESLYKNLYMTSENTGLNKEIRPKKIVVSLTTYSYRIKDVYLTIESLLNQSVKPDRIILWLADDEYDMDIIPGTLKRQISRGLEVKFCKDLKSYKKLIPTLDECPDDIIITIDDDIMYPIDFVEGLYYEYLKNPEYIYCYRARLIPNEKKLYDYAYWLNTDFSEPSEKILPIGMGGVLYTADKFDKDILDENKFMTLAPKADDIWFKAMSLLKDKKCKLVQNHKPFDKRFVEIPFTQDIALCNTNLKENGNNLQIKNVFQKYNIKL